MTAAYYLAINWKGETKRTSVTPNDSVAFITELEEADVHATESTKLTRTGKPVICHIYGKNNNANRCPDREESTPGKRANKAEETPQTESPPTKASVNLTIGENWGYNTNYGGLMFYQVTAGNTVEYQHTLIQTGGHTNTTWILLNNHSTVDVFSNRCLLKNIRKSDRALEIFSTGGHTTTNLQGDLPGYGTIWFHIGGIVKIMSLSKVSEKYWVSYNSTGENKFLVYLTKGEVRSFTQCKRGLL